MLADAHMHLFYWDDDAVPPLLTRARRAGVGAVINLGVTPRTSQRCVQQAKAIPLVFAGVGIHPLWVKGEPRADAVDAIRALAREEEVRFIGEIGLDTVGNSENVPHQEQVFRSMIRLAKEVCLPINVHSRQAHRESLAILRQEGPPPKGGIIHSFSGTLEEMKAYLDIGMTISLGLPVYRKVQGYEDIVRQVPEDRMVLETDAVGQHISPENPPEPATLAEIARDVAALRGTTLEALQEKTAEVLEGMMGPLK